MKKTIVGAVAGVLLLAGCSFGAKEPTQAPTEVQQTQPAAPAPTTPASKEVPPKPADTKPADTTVSGDITAPGTTVNGAAVLPFINHDDVEAVFSHQVASIELAPESDVAAILEKVPQVNGMNVYYLRVNSKYVSGANLEFSAFYTDLRPVDTNGNPMQELTLIGWDNCESNSIPSGGGLDGTIIENCFAAVAPQGGNEPGGVSWAPFDTPYKDAPVIITKS